MFAVDANAPGVAGVGVTVAVASPAQAQEQAGAGANVALGAVLEWERTLQANQSSTEFQKKPFVNNESVLL